ncbi:hypothetical protein [Spirosoma sp. KUDC1026]|uniref:hypothetical protein n=1 Tax=Spirosoma sp. KUDC1026 TaxID=2745947 RepID=UPI001E3026D9|nr:hypothetical protein [Spirosoma sp. KUDC1026]
MKNLLLVILCLLGSQTIAQQSAQRERDIRSTQESTVLIDNDSVYVRSAVEPISAPALSPDAVSPTSMLVREDKENGRLWMQYVFRKDNEELIVERTANVLGKTEREKQAIIKETERNLGIRPVNQ